MAASSTAEVQSRLSDVQSRVDTIKHRIASLQGGVSGSSGAFGETLAGVLGALGTEDSISYGAAIMPASDVDGEDIIAGAKKYLGIPYVYGGNDPSKGLDCSSLVQLVYKDFGISLPRVAADQAREGTAVPSLAQAKPGDLVAFGKPVDHIGIYAGNNKMIVAPHTGDVVKVQDVYKTPVTIRRILPESQPFSASSGGTVDLSSINLRGSSSSFGSLSSQYDSMFSTAGAKYGISPKLLAAVAKAESGFNANARSGAGAQGLMQIMPGTAKGLGVNPLVPSEAIDGAAKMLSGLVKKFGSHELALAAYNAGPGAVQKHNGIPPYKETQNYVKRVLNYAGAIS